MCSTRAERIERGKPDEILEAYTKFLQVVEDAMTLEEV